MIQMKTCIIYASNNGTTRKIAKALADKIKGEVETIPIAKAKSACLLKYDFVIIAGSIHYGRIQGEIRSFVNKNYKTILGINYGLFISCIFEDKVEEYLVNSFSEEIVNSAFITTSFGGEVDPNKGNFITKKMIKTILKSFEEEEKEAPHIDWEKVDEFANEINEKINK